MKKLLFTLLILTLASGVQAGNSWLDNGTNMLKSLSNSGNKTEKKSQDSSALGLSVQEIADGLKQALQVGSERVVDRLGAVDGFNSDEQVHIPLPRSLSTVKALLDKAGLSSLTDDLELRLNRAAEAAAPQARQLFLDAISTMSFEDAQAIYNGADDAATQYFKEKMSPSLTRAMEPVVDNALSQVNAVQSYDTMIKEYKRLPFVPDVKSNLTDHVVDKGMAGIFLYMAKEEKAIRENPVKRTTELLKKVFQ